MNAKPVNIHKAPRRLFVGFKVRLLQDLKTNGGDVFKTGTIMEITGRWRGVFSLKLDTGRISRRCISGVSAGSFVQVPS